MYGSTNSETCLSGEWRVLLVIALCLSLVSPGRMHAGNESKKGTAGAQELLLPIGARGIGLGGSNLATTKGIESIYWNPAGVAVTGGQSEALFSHMNYIADIGVNFGAVTLALEGIGVLGLSAKSIDFGSIPVTTELFPEGTGESFSPSFTVFGLTYARALTDRISVGATVKLVSEKILQTSATGVAFDGGAQYEFGADTPLSGIRFAIALKNLGPTMQYDGSNLDRKALPVNAPPDSPSRTLRYAAEEFEMPTTLELGLAYDYMPFEGNRLTANAVLQNANFGNDEYKTGLEYAFNEQFFLRGGYLYAPASASTYSSIYGFSGGAGVNLDIGGLRVQVDYAYRQTKYFSGTNSLAVTLVY